MPLGLEWGVERALVEPKTPPTMLNMVNQGVAPTRTSLLQNLRFFRGTGGVITLTRWMEKIESVFDICSCPDELKVKFDACTFADAALSWWNGHVKTLTLAVASSMSWEDLNAMLLAE